MKIEPGTRLGYDFGIGFWTALGVVAGIFILLKKLIGFLYVKFFVIGGIHI